MFVCLLATRVHWPFWLVINSRLFICRFIWLRVKTAISLLFRNFQSIVHKLYIGLCLLNYFPSLETSGCSCSGLMLSVCLLAFRDAKSLSHVLLRGFSICHDICLSLLSSPPFNSLEYNSSISSRHQTKRTSWFDRISLFHWCCHILCSRSQRVPCFL